MKILKNSLISRLCTFSQIRISSPKEDPEKNDILFTANHRGETPQNKQNLALPLESKKINLSTFIVAVFLKLLIPPSQAEEDEPLETGQKRVQTKIHLIK